ncbi:MAG: glycosyltransferase [Nitrosospira sp.]|nr:glycosyltransferase [Nitrosospira sp.]
MPKISIILTSSNQEKHICTAIESVLRQSFKDFELIIWDDGSKDDSWKLIQRYTDSRIKTFRNDWQRLPSYGINTAITKIAAGEYIAIHDANDIWEEDKLEKQIEFLNTHPEIGAVFTNALAIGEDGQPEDNTDHHFSTVSELYNRGRHEWLNYFFYYRNALRHSSVLIRKRCYSDCGMYGYGLAHLADLDMWIRLCLKYEIHILQENLVKFRIHAREINEKGRCKEARIREFTELSQLYHSYLLLVSFEDFVAVFPRAEGFRRKDGFVLEFVLAMLSLEQESLPAAKAFGVMALFKLLRDARTAEKIKALYGFDYVRLIEITGRHDIFSYEAIMTLAERDREIDSLRQELGKKQDEIAVFNNSTSWTITAPLRDGRRFLAELATKLRPLASILRRIKHGKECYQAKILVAPQMARQRTVHVIGNFITGGSSRLVVDLFERMGHLYEQEVVTQYNPTPPNYRGIAVHEFAGTGVYKAFSGYLHQYQPKLIHIHYWEDTRWYGKMIKAAREFGCEVIENINTPTYPYKDVCIRRYIYVSDYVKNKFGDRGEPNTTIYPGSNFTIFSRDDSLDIPDDCIGMVYRLDMDKLNKRSIDVFIKVVQRRPQTKVLIVGGGRFLKAYEAEVRKHRVQTAFNFVGFVPYEKLVEFYAQMSLFVAPVWKESFGQVTPFAMSMGIPVVGYNVGALREITGDASLLAEPENSDALARIIIDLLNDKARARQIGYQNRERARRLFSIEKMINSYIELYQELIGNGR